MILLLPIIGLVIVLCLLMKIEDDDMVTIVGISFIVLTAVIFLSGV